MKVLILIYDDYAEFEISILDTMLRANGIEVITCADIQSGDYVVSSGGLQVLPHCHINDVDPVQYSALVIPGGRTHLLLGSEHIRTLIRDFRESDIYIAAICGGPALLADTGILADTHYTTSETPSSENYADVFPWKNKLNQIVVTDRKVTTATGSAYVEFAEEVLRKLGVVTDDEPHPLEYFRYPGMS